MYDPDLLDEVNRAISVICSTGQSYQIGTRRMTRAELSTLYKMRNDLLASKQSTESGGLMEGTTVAYFDRR